MVLRVCVFALLAFATLTVITDRPALAQFSKFSNDLKKRPAPKAEEIQKNSKLYVVNVSCKPRGNLRDAIIWFVPGHPTRSQTIILANSPPKRDAKNEKSEIPTDTVAIVHVFSIAGTAVGGTKDEDDQRECNRTFLIKGARPYYLISNINETNSYAEIGKGLAAVTGLITPIATLATGAALPAAAAGFVTNLQGIQKPLTDFLTALNNGRNTVRTTETLQVGSYVFQTSVSEVTVKIQQFPSIALEDSDYLRGELQTQIAAAKRKLNDAGGLDANCRAAETELRRLGFSSPIDIAYGIIVMAANANLDKEKLVLCLGNTFGEPALKIPEGTRVQAAGTGLLFDKKFLINNLPEAPPAQPSFTAIQPRLVRLIIALNQYAATPNPAPSTVSELEALVADQVTIYDGTIDLRVAKTTAPKPRMEALAAIFKEYNMVGCRVETTTATDRDLDGASVMFLALKIGNAQKTTRDKVLVIRPIYTDMKLSRINVNQEHIDVILNAISTCKARVTDTTS